MTRHRPPSGIARGLGFLIPDNWSAEQTPAIVGPIDALREPICSHCQLALHELRREQPAPPVNPHLADVDDPFRARAARHYHGLAATPPRPLRFYSTQRRRLVLVSRICTAANTWMTPVGTMEETAQGSGRFTDVLLHPQVTIGAGGDVKLADRLHEEAHKFCFLANSVNFPVQCEPSTDISTL